MSKRAEEFALKAYPVHPMTISPQEGKHGEILNFDEWLDDFRIGIQSLSANAGFIKGYEQAEKDLGWHSVEESLPPVDEEVIILHDVASEVAEEPLYCIAFGHVIDPDVVVSVKDTPYKVVSHNGWNIPRVRYWMPMPKIKEEENG